jgi:hypothetical protein
MKTMHIYDNISHRFILEWELFWIKIVDEIKTYILCPMTLFRKSYRLWDNVEK